MITTLPQCWANQCGNFVELWPPAVPWSDAPMPVSYDDMSWLRTRIATCKRTSTSDVGVRPTPHEKAKFVQDLVCGYDVRTQSNNNNSKGTKSDTSLLNYSCCIRALGNGSLYASSPFARVGRCLLEDDQERTAMLSSLFVVALASS